MSDTIFEEVRKEVILEKAFTFLTKYKYLLLSLILILLVSVPSWVWWRSSVKAAGELQSELLYEAIEYENEDDIKSAVAVYDKIDKNLTTNKFIAEISDLRKAHLMMKEGKTEEALKLYSDIGANKKVDREISQLAKLFYVSSAINTGKEYGDVSIDEILEDLTKKDSPWLFSALEMKAFYAISKGKTDIATEIFQGLLKEQRLPYNMRIRTNKVLKTLQTKDS